MKPGEASPVDTLQERLGYRFRDPSLLGQALTHPSAAQDTGRPDGGNQRLEFLGDAVLQLVITRALFDLHPADREGALSARRAALTKGAFLSGLAREIGLDSALTLGSSEEATGGRDRDSALEDAFEALVGAILLDGGFEAAGKAVLGVYADLSRRLSGVEGAENPKGRLQEKVQPLHGNGALRYDTVGAGGADHAREFESAVLLNGVEIGRGRGSSKKLAEEAAARVALDSLG